MGKNNIFHITPAIFLLIAMVSSQSCFSPSINNKRTLAMTLGDTFRLAGTSTGIQFNVNVSETGKLYYVVVANTLNTLKSSEVKAYATGATGGNVLKVGSVAVSTQDSNVNLAVALGLPENYGSSVTVYAVFEGDIVGLYSDSQVMKVEGVLPSRISMQTFTSTVAPFNVVPVNTIRYYAYLPPGYYDHPSRTYPVLMYFHGGASMPNPGDAANNETIFFSGATNMKRDVLMDQFLNHGLDVPYIVIAPQCNNIAGSGCLAGWNGAAGLMADELMETARARYRVDSKRIYVTGMSLGGEGSIRYAWQYATKVAAVLPMAATAVPAGDLAVGNLCQIENNNVKSWFLHLEGDTISPYNQVNGSQAVHNYINACAGGNDPSTYTLLLTANGYCADPYSGADCHDVDPFVWGGALIYAGLLTPTTVAADLVPLMSAQGISRMIDWFGLHSKP